MTSDAFVAVLRPCKHEPKEEENKHLLYVGKFRLAMKLKEIITFNIHPLMLMRLGSAQNTCEYSSFMAKSILQK